MRFIGSVIVVGLLLTTSAPAQPKYALHSTRSESENQVRRLINKWSEAESAGDFTLISGLLAPDFSFVGGMSRSEYLNAAGGNDGIVSIDFSAIEEIELRSYGSAVLATTLKSFKTKAERRGYPTNRFWEMTVWRWQSNKWECLKAAVFAVPSSKHRRIQQWLAADGAIACFSSNSFPSA